MSLSAILALVASLTATPPVVRLLDALRDRDVKEKADYWIARCPAHEDAKHSLSISVGDDGRALVKCHAGCKAADVASAVGLSIGDLFAGERTTPNGNGRAPDPAKRRYLAKSYPYVDEDGNVLFESCRYEPKDFNQRRRDEQGNWVYNLKGIEPVLYRLPDLIVALEAGRPVHIVEGEKDADTLTEAGYIATTNPMGAGKWRDEFSPRFKGATVVVFADNDVPGEAHAQQVATSVLGAGARIVKLVRLPGLPPKGDVTDWLSLGHNLDELQEVIDRTEPFGPKRIFYRLDEIWENDNVMRPPPVIAPRIAWAGRSTLLAAGEKIGKSTLIGYMAARVSDGGEFLGEPCEKGRVLIVGLEEFIGDAARRLRRFKADPTRVTLCSELPGDPESRPQVIREWIDANDPILVLVDTLIAYGAGRISDAGSSAQTEPVVNELTRIAHDTGAALVLVHHARKSDGRYRDSSAIGGAVDIIIELFVPDENTDPQLRRARARGRVPVIPSFDMRFDGDAYWLDMGKEKPLDDRILDYVRSHPARSISELTEFLSLRRDTVTKRVAQMLADQRLRTTTGKNSKAKYLIMPSAAADALL